MNPLHKLSPSFIPITQTFSLIHPQWIFNEIGSHFWEIMYFTTATWVNQHFWKDSKQYILFNSLETLCYYIIYILCYRKNIKNLNMAKMCIHSYLIKIDPHICAVGTEHMSIIIPQTIFLDSGDLKTNYLE